MRIWGSVESYQHTPFPSSDSAVGPVPTGRILRAPGNQIGQPREPAPTADCQVEGPLYTAPRAFGRKARMAIAVAVFILGVCLSGFHPGSYPSSSGNQVATAQTIRARESKQLWGRVAALSSGYRDAQMSRLAQPQGSTAYAPLVTLGYQVSNEPVVAAAPRRPSPPAARAPRAAKPASQQPPAQPVAFSRPLPKAPPSALALRVQKIIEYHSPRHADAKLLAQRIVKESLAQGYDPLFVAAVIKSESGFNHLARSHVGARGLMQIMPATGKYLASRHNVSKLQLFDTEQNLRLGISFLKELEASYGGDKVMTLVAYNWGPGHVQSAGKGRRKIPGEVMRYAVKILNDYRRWRGETQPPKTVIG